MEAEQDGARRVNEATLNLEQLKADVGKTVQMVVTEGKVRTDDLQAQSNLELEQLRQERALLISTSKVNHLNLSVSGRRDLIPS